MYLFRFFCLFTIRVSTKFSFFSRKLQTKCIRLKSLKLIFLTYSLAFLSHKISNNRFLRRKISKSQIFNNKISKEKISHNNLTKFDFFQQKFAQKRNLSENFLQWLLYMSRKFMFKWKFRETKFLKNCRICYIYAFRDIERNAFSWKP